jgi:hypothetical protein
MRDSRLGSRIDHAAASGEAVAGLNWDRAGKNRSGPDGAMRHGEPTTVKRCSGTG